MLANHRFTSLGMGFVFSFPSVCEMCIPPHHIIEQHLFLLLASTVRPCRPPWSQT